MADGKLTLREVNAIWRANVDPNYWVTVDAAKLKVVLTSAFGDDNRADAKIIGPSDWLVHGSVKVERDAKGALSIVQEKYDFEMHGSFFSDVKRNSETYLGFVMAFSFNEYGGYEQKIGTDFDIRFSGAPTYE